MRFARRSKTNRRGKAAANMAHGPFVRRQKCHDMLACTGSDLAEYLVWDFAGCDCSNVDANTCEHHDGMRAFHSANLDSLGVVYGVFFTAGQHVSHPAVKKGYHMQARHLREGWWYRAEVVKAISAVVSR